MASPASGHPSTRIERNGFIADIIISKNGSGELFHYVIQRNNSLEIVHWGQELSIQRAMECIDAFIDDFVVKKA